MIITLTPTTGTGPTRLAAFDAALQGAGVEQYNLIHLSSVIPPGTLIERRRHHPPDREYGHRLYVVMAHETADEPGTEAWAGLGWVQEPDDGRGLFVECTGHDEAEVRHDIETTLCAMMRSRGRDYGPIRCELSGALCRDEPVCAMVVAVYESAGWATAGTHDDRQPALAR